LEAKIIDGKAMAAGIRQELKISTLLSSVLPALTDHRPGKSAGLFWERNWLIVLK
jgi:hypothetical protein